MTVKKLIELFPKYEKEIEKLSGELACGCSSCVWGVLKSKHNELNDGFIPERFLNSCWG